MTGAALGGIGAIASKGAGLVGICVASVGALDSDKWIAIGGAVIAVGSVLVPAVIDWYKRGRAVIREERERDVVASSETYAKEVRRRAELEVRLAQITEQLEDLREKAAKGEDKLRDIKGHVQEGVAKIEDLATKVQEVRDKQAVTPGADDARQ